MRQKNSGDDNKRPGRHEYTRKVAEIGDLPGFWASSEIIETNVLGGGLLQAGRSCVRSPQLRRRRLADAAKVLKEPMPDSGLDDELVARLRAGEDHAFADLFSRHRGRLKQMLEFRLDRRLRGREDSSDILQQVYIDAHKNISSYLKRPQLSFYVWLRQLTSQRLIDVYRRHMKAERRDVRQEISIDKSNSGVTSASMAIQLAALMPTPSQVAMQAEMIAQIESSLQSMDSLDREILALRHFEELRNSEVAEVLGIKEAAASNRYVRALTRLRETLEKLPGFFDEA